MRTKTIMAVFLLLALLPAVLVGCSDDGDTAAPSTTVPATSGNGSGPGTDTTSSPDMSTPSPPSTEPVKDPGFYDLDDATVEAVGIFAYRDLEGGFWAVVDTADPNEAADADVLAVFGPSSAMPGPVKSYEGKYVSVVGEPKGASVYQAGPFVEVTSIRILAATPAE